MLAVKKLSKKIGDFEVKEVSFTVNQGNYLILSGPSGAGKSLVLEMITGLLTPDSGKVILNGVDITKHKIQKRAIGLVFQNQALFPHLTVKKNIEYGPRCFKYPKLKIKKMLEKIVDEINIGHLLKRYPNTLSGGEAQRVALARTLIMNPACICLDEPLSSLDYQSKHEMLEFLSNLNKKGQTFIHITHDLQNVIKLATHTILMKNGMLSNQKIAINNVFNNIDNKMNFGSIYDFTKSSISIDH